MEEMWVTENSRISLWLISPLVVSNIESFTIDIEIDSKNAFIESFE